MDIINEFDFCHITYRNNHFYEGENNAKIVDAKVDSLLVRLNFYAYIITHSKSNVEIKCMFDYCYKRIAMNQEIKKYFDFLREYSRDNKVEFMYHNLEIYGLKLCDDGD